MHPLLEPYYTETEPDLRKNKLDAYSTEPNTQADQYRKDLFSCRHMDKKHPEKLVDRFLFNLISLATIVKSPGLFPKFRKREVLSILSSMQMDERPLQDPECEAVLYWEYRNAVRRYIATCDDPSYGRTLLGMKPSDAAGRREKCCEDVWSFSFGVAALVGLEKEMATLCQAANDEYCALHPEVESLESEHNRYSKKR
jgi:hypothetical protein